MATTLPTEIITEILSRLPVKSLLRFLCVNKSWYSLIKSPNFIKLHLHQTLISNSDSYLFHCNGYLYISELNLEDIHNPLSFSKDLHHPLNPFYVHVVGCCNGILCISDFHRINVFFYNPLTKTHRQLPVNNMQSNKYNPLVYGFGYDSLTDDYKFFCYYEKKMGFVCGEAQVFSLKRNSWESVQGMCEFDYFANTNGVYLKEAMYYVVYKEEELDLDRDRHRNFIVKFDFRTNTMLRVKCPKFDDNSSAAAILAFSALNGCLCMLVSYFPKGSFDEDEIGEEDCPLVRADLWMMKDDSWVRFFNICDPQSVGIHSWISTIICSRDGSRIMLVVDRSKLGWYDLDDGSFETVTTFGLPEFWMNASLCYFSGSLVSLIDDKL